MLRRFIYLNTHTLAQYISMVEGGLIDADTRRTKKAGRVGGGVDAKVIHASGDSTSENENSRVYSDTPEAQFERLLKAAEVNAEELDWAEIIQPDVDFPTVARGTMVSWEADFYVPDAIKMLAKSGGAIEAIDLVKGLLPSAQRLGLSVAEIPDADTLGAMSTFLTSMKSDLVAVGESDDCEWQVAGRLQESFLRDDVEGPARIVGKVNKVVPEGSWQNLVTFPGMDLISRAERRARASTKPEPGQENNFLYGPLVMLDVLAIYV